jgi:glycosyltransferase involved in cell wall biosynthesis
VRTIYDGLPQQLLTPLPARPRYFAFLARISPEKGVERAISIARHSGAPADCSQMAQKYLAVYRGLADRDENHLRLVVDRTPAL